MGEIQFTENDLRVDEYQALRAQVGWAALTQRQAQAALQGSLYLLCARDTNGAPLGMGRIVGDGASICYIQDLIVLPCCRRRRLGTQLIERLQAFTRALVQGEEQMRLCLMCAKGREPFYESCGFIARPTDQLGPGMMRVLPAVDALIDSTCS